MVDAEFHLDGQARQTEGVVKLDTEKRKVENKEHEQKNESQWIHHRYYKKKLQDRNKVKAAKTETNKKKTMTIDYRLQNGI